MQVPGGSKKIIAKIHVNLGHASAQQLERLLVDSGRENMHLLNFAGNPSEHCEVCRALNKATHVPIAVTAAESMFNEKSKVDILFLNSIIALHVMDAYSEYLPLIPARSETSREVRDVSCGCCVRVFGQP